VLEDMPLPAVPTANPEDNFYRHYLEPDQVQKLDRAATRSGLTDEVAYLRLMLQEAHWQRDTNAAVKIMNALARAEEADARLARLRPKDDDRLGMTIEFFKERLKELTALNRGTYDEYYRANAPASEGWGSGPDEAPAL
jgi:hypothetical protein